MRRSLWLVLALAVVLGGVFWWYRSAHGKEVVSYDTETVTRGDVTARVTSTGTLQAVTKVTVGSQVSGIIDTIYVDFNSRVRKGQVLAQIDASLFQAQLQQAQASLNSALAGYNNALANAGNALSNVKSAEAGIATARAHTETARAALANARAARDTAQANVERTQAEVVQAKRNFERFESLLRKDLVAKSERDQAQTQYLVAVANLDASRSQLDASHANYRSAQAGIEASLADLEAARIKRESAAALVDAARAQIASAQAQVSQARASVQSASVNLSRTIIRSPINGIVLARNINVGQTVAAQFQAPDLFTLAENLQRMQVETAVDEADIGKVRVGADVGFTVDAYSDEEFKGRVTSVRQSPTTVQNVVTYQVIVECDNPGLKLKPGMTATVNISVEKREGVLLLPNAAIRFKPPRDESSPSPSPSASRSPRAGGSGTERRRGDRRVSVWVLAPNDPTQLVEKKVQPGVSDGAHTEIVSGDLAEGQAVVIGTGSGSGGGKSGGRRVRFF